MYLPVTSLSCRLRFAGSTVILSVLRGRVIYLSRAIARLPRRLIKCFFFSFFSGRRNWYATALSARCSENHRPNRNISSFATTATLPAARRLSRSSRMTCVTNKNASSRPNEQACHDYLSYFASERSICVCIGEMYALRGCFCLINY